MTFGKHFLILCTLLVSLTAQAQLEMFPIHKNNPSPTTTKSNAKVSASVPLSLPFWDDFSFATTKPVDSLWKINKYTIVSDGLGINAPTINVATFDGLNENGTPFSAAATDVLDYGYRDTLESQPINLAEVDFLTQQDSVFLSFYYQWGGHGEPPDLSDFLRLEFKSNTGWETVLTLQKEDEFDPTLFYDTLVQLKESRFFHDDFQFRFISFGRKSGRYDAWHVDYVYLNDRRHKNDRYRPDRALSTKPTTLFDGYYSIPIKHLDSSRMVTAGEFQSYNLNNVTTTATYLIEGTFTNYFENSSTTYEVALGDTSDIGSDATFEALTRKFTTLHHVPDPNDNNQFDYSTKQIDIKLKLKLFADDVYDIDTGKFSEDYDSTHHYPIDFRTNDTTTQTYTLKDYYAYDDGIAEYSAGLTQAGNQFAYRFDLKTTGIDTLNGLYIYFPFFGGTAPSNMLLMIFADDNGAPGELLHEELIPVTQKANNEFVERSLTRGVLVEGSFFIGYQEPSTGRVRIGLDKSSDSGDRMFYRNNEFTDTWELNDRVTGNLMIRPRIGIGDVTTSLPEDKPNNVVVYPNPSQGEFFIKGNVQTIEVISLAGQRIAIETEAIGEETKISVQAPAGIYLLKGIVNQKPVTQKILVKP